MSKWVYLFHEGRADMKDLLGGKGAGLAEMTRAGLPVPPGFTITTEACRYYSQQGRYPDGLEEQVAEALRAVESQAGKGFGDKANPLLVSVRSGAKFSMPGMMDTVLNLGLNDETVQGMLAQTQNGIFAFDAYRRFIMMFSDVVLGLSKHPFEQLYTEIVGEVEKASAERLRKLVEKSKEYVKRQGQDFPTDPQTQLQLAIEAVFKSWNNPRAAYYRKAHKIPDDLGTAVNVQSMVFGNMGETSATGVAFTRNPSTGARELYGEYLINAQGEDVVAGIRTPRPLIEMQADLPEVFAQFEAVSQQLEQHSRDMQDIEFTVEKGQLYLLQTRTGKRTPQAAVKIAVDMATEGMISQEEALLRIEPLQLDALLHKQIDEKAELKIIARGLPASPGAATGAAVFDADSAEEMGLAGKKVILIRPETCPDDIHGLHQAQGVLTSRGGMTSHAAVVARQMAKPCVAGCESLHIDLDRRVMQVEGLTLREGDELTINGSTGDVIVGSVEMIEPSFSPELVTLLAWSTSRARLQIRTNADTPEDAQKAREFGAVGIGLCRTEHMFMAPERLPIMRQMILADSLEERNRCLARLLPMQISDFAGIFRAMDGYPVTIRLLDPPLHEFLPNYKELLQEVLRLRQEKGTDDPEYKEKQHLLERLEDLSETNPMLGLRGCRLGLTQPEINKMQVQAIIEAAISVQRDGVDVRPEIMVPLVGHANELKIAYELLNDVAVHVMAEQGEKIAFQLGTMIELPRAALTADAIAEYAHFFSFGTNDLTQMTFGFSRDDAERKFLQFYLEHKILPENPFHTLDRDGVGQLIAMAIAKGRQTRPDLKLGLCGEHGADPASIELAHELGLDYVSCSPYRVPIARVAAAQAALKQKDRQPG